MNASQGKKSRTCLGKKTGTPVTEYNTSSDAISAASYTKAKFGTDLSPYQCATCHLWHLAPPSNNSSSSSGNKKVDQHLYRNENAATTNRAPMNTSQGKKSRTCLGKKTGAPVAEYKTRSDAINGASYTKAKFGTDLSPYQCATCHLWHLAPPSNNNSNNAQSSSSSCGPPPVKSKTCRGVKSGGAPLTEYMTQQDAQKGADYANTNYKRADNSFILIPYSCSTCYKWHLSLASLEQAANHQPHISTPHKKSLTCIGHATGQPVTEYETLQEAQQAMEHINVNSDDENTLLIPYQCFECCKWHLSPKSRQTPSTSSSSSNGCHCRGESSSRCGTHAATTTTTRNSSKTDDGAFKQSYLSRQDAERRAAILSQEQGVRLYVYQCPSHSNRNSVIWHLTRREQRF
jgi:hypothetical protein